MRRGLDVIIAALVALITGREVLRALRGGPPLERTASGRAHAARTTVPERVRATDRPDYPPGVERPPRPSVWPMVMGGGLVLLLFGVVTSYAFIAIGLLLMVGAIAGWIGDLLYAGAD